MEIDLLEKYFIAQKMALQNVAKCLQFTIENPIQNDVQKMHVQKRYFYYRKLYSKFHVWRGSVLGR